MAGWWQRLSTGLKKTRDSLKQGLAGLGRAPDPAQLEELEELLLGADIGIRAVTDIIDACGRGEEPVAVIRRELGGRLRVAQAAVPDTAPEVILLVGVNGTGKTTTAARLAHRRMADGQRVVLAASDTFRAAAADQLETWARRIGCEVIRGTEGSDPAAVAFDAAQAARAREADALIVDTAGRLHTRSNLMQELNKIARVLSRVVDGAPHQVLLVIDATTGQNAVAQARLFQEAVGVTGLVLTKLDGTARGGVVVAIADELDLPVAYVGVGEEADDLVPFDVDDFVSALLGEQ